MNSLTVAQVMEVDVPRLDVDTTVEDAVRALAAAPCSCVVMISEAAPVGVLSEADCVTLLCDVFDGRALAGVRLGEVVSTRSFSIQQNDSVERAMELGRSADLRYLPVTDARGRCIGVLSRDGLRDRLAVASDKSRGLASQEVARQLRMLIDANNQLQEASLEDPLTGAGNRRAMTVDLKYADRLKHRYGNDYSVLLVDVDFFKKYNDLYGHAAGDEALRRVAEELRSTIRDCDRVFRYGGEEFLILLPETALDGAIVLARRLVGRVAELALPHESSEHRVVTISCGVAEAHDDRDENWERVVERADRGLYQAKKQGRNRCAEARVETQPAQRSISFA